MLMYLQSVILFQSGQVITKLKNNYKFQKCWRKISILNLLSVTIAKQWKKWSISPVCIYRKNKRKILITGFNWFAGIKHY